MSVRLLTADQVKEYLNIPDFRSLSRDKIIEFVSAIPLMDKDVAIKIIEQFPEFSNYAQVIVSHFDASFERILAENGNSSSAVLEGYRATLVTLGELAQMENTSPEDRRFFAQKMIEVTDRMAEFDSCNKRFFAGMAKLFAWVAGCGLLIGSIVLGVHMKGTEIPTIS